jgi:hypothetical protein
MSSNAIEEILIGYLITFPDGEIHHLKIGHYENQELTIKFEKPFPGSDEPALTQ